MTLDLEGPAGEGGGLYGCEAPRAEAHAVVIPVPYEATVSYRTGTARGPAAVLQASRQVDLYDLDLGHVCEAGIHQEEPAPELLDLAPEAREAAERVIKALTHGSTPSQDDYALVERSGERVKALVGERFTAALAEGKLPVLLGGDHSTPLGAILACAKHTAAHGGEPLGILQLDAHADLREAYEGFRYSHASIMWNVLREAKDVRLVSVGIRDFCGSELAIMREDPRVKAFFDRGLRKARLAGRMSAVLDDVVASLPHKVYLSFDIDGLEPAFCPGTGTPVPGGLTFGEVVELLERVVDSGRTIVGMDLNEVAPAYDLPDDELDGWDGIVAARMLYKMIGFALASRGQYESPKALPCGTAK